MALGGTRARRAGRYCRAGGGWRLRLAAIHRISPRQILVSHNDAVADRSAVRGRASAKQALRHLNSSIPVRQQPMWGVAGIEPPVMAPAGSPRASGTIVSSQNI